MFGHKSLDLRVQGIRSHIPCSAAATAATSRAVSVPVRKADLVAGHEMMLPVADDVLHFLIAQEGAVQTLQATAAGLEQHVAAAQQVLGTGLVQDGARIMPRRDLERDAAGEVGLGQAGHHVHAGALGGQDHMDARGTGQLGQTHDAGLHLAGSRHHQVGQFVDDDDQIGQGLQIGQIRRELTVVAGQALIVGSHVAYAHAGHGLIALVHLMHGPVKSVLGFAHLRHHRMDQVRLIGVHGHFDALGVH